MLSLTGSRLDAVVPFCSFKKQVVLFLPSCQKEVTF